MSTPCSFSIRLALAPRGPTLSSINLLADQRDGPLIDRSSIPCLDCSEVGFAGLMACARVPAMGPEEIRRRGQRVGRVVEISARAVVQDAFGQKLGLADLTMHGAARVGRENSAIDQCQRGVKLIGEKGRPSAVIGESRYSRQRVLVSAL